MDRPDEELPADANRLVDPQIPRGEQNDFPRLAPFADSRKVRRLENPIRVGRMFQRPLRNPQRERRVFREPVAAGVWVAGMAETPQSGDPDQPEVPRSRRQP